MESPHSLLTRQLKRCFGPDFLPPAEWAGFVDAVNAAYHGFDRDREMLERSLELSSQELLQTGAEIRAVFRAIPDLLIRFDAQGGILNFKIGMAGDELLTPETADVKGQAATAAAHAGPELRAAVLRVAMTREPATVEYALETAGAGSRYEARLVPALENEVVAFVRDITERKGAEEALFSSREMLRTILDTIPQRVFWKDRDSVYLGCNRPFAEDSGITEAAAIVGKATVDLDSPARTERFRTDDLLVMNTDQPKLNYEEQRDSPVTQERRWLKTSKVPLHDERGRVIGVLGTYEDITERKLDDLLRAGQNRVLEMIATGAPLPQTLADLARLMETQMEGARCAILLVEPEGRYLTPVAAPGMPPEFAAMAGQIPVGEGFGSCGTAVARKQRVIAADIAQDPPWENFQEFARKFGIRACWSTPIMSRDASVLGTIATYFGQPRHPGERDLRLADTAARFAGIAIQRQQAEAALQGSVALLQSTFDSTADGIIVADREGRIVTFNQRVVSLLRIPASIPDLRAPFAVRRYLQSQVKDPVAYLRRVEEIYADPGMEAVDILEFKDGRTYERYSCPHRVDGEPVGRVWSFRDISQRRQLEQQFLQSQKMEAFGQLAGGVAHDFNNMLTVIIGNLSLIRLGELSAANQKTALDDCFYAAQRAANLTSQLLTFSRRQPIEPRDLDLNDVVANLTKMLQRLIGEHIVLEKAYGAVAAGVRADAGMMEQALMNLALNARDAMPDGGTLRIETAVIDLDLAAVTKHVNGRPGRFVRMTVSDTGIGIPQENVPHIFEPFYTTKEVGKGTGLGLATVFGIVEQHAGWIEVESELGVGTTMRVYLPAAPGGPDLPAPAVVARPRRGTETILLAEDEAAVRTLMCKLLRNHGYVVQAACNGVEALALWRQHREKVDLLITDMIMPGGVGGRELAAQLLADRPDLRVIYCSGYTDEALGADVPLRRAPNFLEKPFDVQEFLGRVRRCLDDPVTPAAPLGGAEL